MTLNDRSIKVELDCYPCFLRQTAIALRLAGSDEAMQEKVMKGVLKDIENADVSTTPAHATTYLHRRIRQMLGCDPFKDIKAEYNKKALDLYPGLKGIVSESPEPLMTAARLAIAGNVIDFGIFTSIDIEGTVKRALGQPLDVDDYPAFRGAVEDADEILYLMDNAGEIVFDRILIESLIEKGKKVTAVVKGSAVINDCTMEDAVEAGVTGITQVIDNGSDAVGTILEMTSREFRERYWKAGLIISKGQGNFETLIGGSGHSEKGSQTPSKGSQTPSKGSQTPGEKQKIFFLFQSKCGVVSSILGLPEGAMLLMENNL